MTRLFLSLFVFVATGFLHHDACAIDPLYRRSNKSPIAKSSRDLSITRLVSTRPWKRTPATYRRRTGIDYSQYSLEYEEALSDPRSRLYVPQWDRPIGQLSWTSRMIWLNVGVFILQSLRPSVTRMGIQIPDRIMRGEELYRLITPCFLHGGFAHLGTNMMSLGRSGGDVETLFGPGRFLASYLVAGVAGNMLSAYKTPNRSLGASGAVFGVFGAYFVFLSKNEWALGRSGRAMTNSIVETMGANLLLGAISPSLDNWAHLGGALGGAAVAHIFGPRLYKVNTPDGGRFLVDKPILRTPRFLENMGAPFARLAQRLQLSGSGQDKPWRRNYQVPRSPNTPSQPTGPNRPLPPLA